MKNTDLHTHSYYSDGQISPEKLVRLAKRKGIKNLALTDHNSIRGVKEAMKEGKKIGVKIIPAIEIRAKEGEVLGYFIDIKNKKLNQVIKKQRKKIKEMIKDWCKKLNRAEYNINFKEIQKRFPQSKNNISGFHLLYLLHLKGYGIMLELPKKLKKEKIKRKKIKELSIIKAIKLIKNAKGVPVLAHPWVEEEVLKHKNMKNYLKAGLKGIEINNGDRFPFKKKGINEKIKKIAKKYKLILTSGSDYHGLKLVEQMPGNHELGKNNCDEKVVKQLKEAR
jgi:hypothetical protein